MKKIITFLLVIGVFAFVGVILAIFSHQKLPQEVQKVAAFTPTATPTPPVARPVTLSIPKLNIHAAIESVGMDTTGRMAVPKGVGNTGWYNLGPKPAQAGNAVIDGHFDTPTGAPSVFYSLGTLKKGDTISVTDATNKTYNFTVNRVTSFADSNFPIAEVFGLSNTKNLNLITCSGTWDKIAHNYSNRTVVFSTLGP